MTSSGSIVLQSHTPDDEPKKKPDDIPDTPPTEPPPVPIQDPLPDAVEPGPYVTDEPDET